MKDRILGPDDLGAVWLARSGRRQGWYRHRHDELEANLMLAGSATYIIGERRVRCDRHGLIWLFPGQEHQLVEASADFRMHILVWRPRLVASVATTIGATAALTATDPAGAWHRRLPSDQHRLLVAAVEDLAGTADRRVRDLGLPWILARLWSAYLAAPERDDEADLPPPVAEAVRLLRQSADLALPELARRSGISLAHLGRLFRRHLGVAPVEFRTQVRLELALERIASGEASLTDAALAAGFGSYSQFHRQFHRVHGVGPRAWLAQRADR